MIFFVRIPKTASSLLEIHLRRQLGDDAVLSVIASTAVDAAVAMKRDQPGARVLSGHYPFGAHAFFDGPAHYIGCSRDPLERVVSLYHYVNDERHGRHPYHRPDLDLDGWLDVVDLCDVSNTAVRYLAGMAVAVGDRRALPPVTHEYVTLAKENAQRFLAIGIVERFEPFFRRIEAIFCWPRTDDIGHVNGRYDAPRIEDRPPARDSLPATVVERIDEMNQLDAELHRWIAAELAPR